MPCDPDGSAAAGLCPAPLGRQTLAIQAGGLQPPGYGERLCTPMRPSTRAPRPCACRVDPFLKKDWYEIKAPTMFTVRNVGKTLVTRTQGTKVGGARTHISRARMLSTKRYRQ